MKPNSRKNLYLSIVFLIAFILWTLLVSLVDRGVIGPDGSVVGFSCLNSRVHNFLGVNMALYTLTDWLGIVPIAIAFAFSVLGFVQMLNRKSLFKVDRSILALGVSYISVIAVFLFFENIVINYRPVLIEGTLEASYPSSTTLITLCVIPTAVIELNGRIKNRKTKCFLQVFAFVFTLFMLIGRLLSGVHWVTDIIGGVLVSAGLDMAYRAVK